jgi:hypothetical protein
LQFCRQFQGILNKDPDLPNNLLIIDEANPYELHQCPFMTQKLLSGVMFGPGESLDPTSLRMNTDQPSQSYCNIAFIAPNLPQNHGLWFQQDGAMVHMEVISMAALHRSFLQWVISRFGDVSWPPPSLDRTAPNFFM